MTKGMQGPALLAQESLYVGIDVGKARHVAGFLSPTFLQRHTRFDGCPVLAFEQSREGFQSLVERIRAYVPLEQAFVLMEKTGHYHKALEQYLLDLDVTVYLIHVQTRPKGMLKTDKRDALSLANHLYNQLEKGVQVTSGLQQVRQAIPPTEAAVRLRSLMRHRYELSHEMTRRKNKLVAICDELFPELSRVFTDPNSLSALEIRKRFPTPQDVAHASWEELRAVRFGRYPSEAQLIERTLAHHSIGITVPERQQGLILEQRQLMAELHLFQQHMQELETEIGTIMAHSREGQIITSIPGIGPIQGATILAAIGHIDNFASAAALKSYCGWAPTLVQSGKTLDHAQLTRQGNRTMKQMMFLIVGHAIQLDCEWARIYQRLVPLKCVYDERKKAYIGKIKVMGRLAGQILTIIFALLKQDADLVRYHKDGPLPAPMLYDLATHQAHRAGQYKALKPPQPPVVLVQSPTKAH